ncbi:hypothetical protein [Streptomyces sp. NPDC006368]|uniref:hypothetical protein n=1 Tax=Streptomyces sp. NPDC006368 TaxID=3156760 RepID=UPI0033B34DED
MPRPTAAQLAYGSATVVFSTVAMLLLSRTTTGLGVALIGVAALLLGLLVTLSMPMATKVKAARRSHPAPATGTPAADGPEAGDAAGAARVPRPRTAASRTQAGEHSLRR